ncbi:MAG: anti-sigma factor antagonist [Zetaproteobacteria bacterium]|nr:MAG: anti-sigma factor antagonist [Zetaproteobacteria bacterium]
MARASRFGAKTGGGEGLEIVGSVGAEGAVSLRLDGTLDYRSAPRLLQALRRCMRRGAEEVVVDLSGLEAIDSAGIATLVEGLRWSRRGGGRFALTGVGIRVRDALALAGLEEAFPVV